MKNVKYPPILHWEVTPNCNHNCIHCYNYWRRDCECIRVEKNNALIDYAKKIVDLKPVAVVVTGGEPLLVFNELKESLLLLKNNGIIVSINSNASLVSDEIAIFLAKNRISLFVSFPCSKPDICDYITNIEGSFDKITKGILKLNEHGVKFSVNMVVSKKNLPYIFSSAKYAKEKLGVNRFFASRVSKPVNATETFDTELLSKDEIELMLSELCRIKKELSMEISTGAPIPACLITNHNLFNEFAYKKTCTAGRFSYCIDSLGNVKACVRDSNIYGNILTESFSEIWNKMKDWKNDIFVPTDCKKCEKLFLCRTGCRMESVPFTHKLDCMDTAARTENLPIKYENPTILEKQYDKEQDFCVYPTMNLVKEDFGYRLNCFAQYTYITFQFGEFLKENKEFNITKICNIFNQDYKTVNSLINKLIEKQIIYEKRIRK